MSRTSSPRPSVTSIQSPTPTSSQRPSLDLHSSANTLPQQRSRNVSPAGVTLNQRRNRAALRDYYNLKPPSPSPSTDSVPRSHAAPPSPPPSEFDAATFSPEDFVTSVLGTSNLSALLALENRLVSEIKGLDGERKALVYDNYSKLIAAMETIGRMRGNMGENVGPKAAGTLGPVMGHIVETAIGMTTDAKDDQAQRQLRKRASEKETVRWVLGAPVRLKKMLDEGRREDAVKEWETVEDLLDKWKGVKGVEEVRKECRDIMEVGEG